MKKTFDGFPNGEERTVGYGSAYAYPSNTPDYLVGRLLTIIEAIGLPSAQEKSLKDLLGQEVYLSLKESVWIPGNLHNIIVDFYNWYQEESPRLKSSGTPMGASINRGQEPVDHTMNGTFVLEYEE